MAKLECAAFHHIRQFDYGCEAIKLTTLMCFRLPTIADRLRQFKIQRLRPPSALIGRRSASEWKTAAAKEYPRAMCSELGAAASDAIAKAYFQHGVADANFVPMDIPEYAVRFVPDDPYIDVDMGQDYCMFGTLNRQGTASSDGAPPD